MNSLVLPRSVDITFEEGTWTFLLRVPYNPFFNQRLKELVGKGQESGLAGYEWVRTLRAWRLWLEDYDKVIELVNRFFK